MGTENHRNFPACEAQTTSFRMEDTDLDEHPLIGLHNTPSTFVQQLKALLKKNVILKVYPTTMCF